MPRKKDPYKEPMTKISIRVPVALLKRARRLHVSLNAGARQGIVAIVERAEKISKRKQ